MRRLQYGVLERVAADGRAEQHERAKNGNADLFTPTALVILTAARLRRCRKHEHIHQHGAHENEEERGHGDEELVKGSQRLGGAHREQVRTPILAYCHARSAISPSSQALRRYPAIAGRYPCHRVRRRGPCLRTYRSASCAVRDWLRRASADRSAREV